VAEWEKAFDAIASERGAALVRYAYLLCGDWSQAEDLVQDALVKAFTRGRSGTSIANVEGYVRRAIATTSVDGFRVQKRWSAVRHLFVSADTYESGAEAVGDRMDLAEALARLSPRQRTCIVLRYYEDLPIAEIADQLGFAVGTAKRYLFDGVRALEAQLGPLADGVDDDATNAPTIDVILEGSTP
jgi:RNA polymerase sigma-70 factor (ECF subfamily)